MPCVICKHGEPKAGTVTVALQRDRSTVIFEAVPADVCQNCGEYYLNEDVTRELLRRADLGVRNGAEVEILSYAA